MDGQKPDSQLFFDSYSSPLGPMTMACDGEALVGLWYDGQKHDRAGVPVPAPVLCDGAGDVPAAVSNQEDSTVPAPVSDSGPVPDAVSAVFGRTREWLATYFQGCDPGFTPPLKVNGSSFRQTVCDIMLGIPFGATVTYADIAREAARRMGRKSMSTQAVGGAVGHNPIGIIIPCHRVIGSDGSLTGYAGGLERKEFLLRLEGHFQDCLF